MNPSNQAIHNAFKNQLVVPAFNVPYLPMVEPVVRAAVDTDTFVFVAVSRLEWIKFEAKGIGPVIEEYRKWARPGYTRLHLDHMPVIDEDQIHIDYVAETKEAIGFGYDSVMLDGSRLSLEDNIKATKTIADLAHAAGVPCEAELGAVLGHEAGPLPPYEELFASGRGFTDPAEARRFAQESGCDWLSVAIGNVHGAVSAALRDQKKVEARLNLDHLKKLRDVTGIPLVLHGGSGIQREYVLESFKAGIAKLNVGTEIRQAYEVPLRETGSVEAAQEACYQRTAWLLREFFELAGTRSTVAGN